MKNKIIYWLILTLSNNQYQDLLLNQSFRDFKVSLRVLSLLDYYVNKVKKRIDCYYILEDYKVLSIGMQLKIERYKHF